MNESIPFLVDVLELYKKTPEGLPLWKTKDIQLTYENLLENIFVLSNDLAIYFEIRHRDLIGRNFRKLKEEGYIDHERKIALMVEIGSSTKRVQTIYAFTRHHTEYLIMDFSGPKARKKKLAILKRLHGIESDVLRGAYLEARQKAQTWDGVQLLKELGFKSSIPNNLATKKDIIKFLKI
ncbi:MAG: Rha family transcriptional regulator, partial [Candidatus Brocadiae bacterium]|nr:Rha family transcriptional regulator [Candidatus Brocadiia bacterium]